MRFAHLSDFHFTTAAENYPALRSGLIDVLSLVVGDLAEIQQSLDFVSITGDLAEAGDTESYLALKHLLSALSTPVFVVPGNHDSRERFRDVFLSPDRSESDETLDYRTVLEHVQVVGLDTLVEGEVGGRLTTAQLAWLQPLLLDDTFSHTVISMHHPPFPIGHVEFEQIATLEGGEQFGSLVRQSKSEIVVLSGHVHRPYQAVWNGAICCIAGAPSFQMGSTFCFGDDPLDVVQEPYAYFIHDIDRNAGHRIGTRYVSLEQVRQRRGNRIGVLS